MNLFSKANLAIGIVFSLVLIISCSSIDNDTSVLNSYLSEQDFNLSDYKAVIVIDDNTCPSCNRKFASQMSDYVGREDIAFVVAASGGAFDTRKFENSGNTILDRDREFMQTNILQSSGVIFMDSNHQVDTIINIDAFSLKESLDFIANSLL